MTDPVTETVEAPINLFAAEEPVEGVPVPEKPAEPIVEPVPVVDPAAERVAARIAAAKRSEINAAKTRAAMNAERVALDAEKAKFAEIKANPLKALNEIGLDPDEFLKRVISDGKPSPESEVQEIKRVLAEQAAENARLKQERDSYFQNQAIQKTQEAFLSMVESRPTDFEYILSEFTPEEAKTYGFQIARTQNEEYKEEHGIDIPDEVIAIRLNEHAKARHDARDSWRSRVIPKPASETGPVQGSGPQASKPNAPRTLSNGAASQKPSAPKAWTQEDADAESIRILDAAMRG